MPLNDAGNGMEIHGMVSYPMQRRIFRTMASAMHPLPSPVPGHASNRASFSAQSDASKCNVRKCIGWIRVDAVHLDMPKCIGWIRANSVQSDMPNCNVSKCIRWSRAGSWVLLENFRWEMHFSTTLCKCLSASDGLGQAVGIFPRIAGGKCTL